MKATDATSGQVEHKQYQIVQTKLLIGKARNMTRHDEPQVTGVARAAAHSKHEQDIDPRPLWIPLAAIFIFVPIMLAVTIVVGYLLFN